MLHPKMNPTRSKSGRTPRALLFFLLLSVFVISALPQEKPKDPSTPRISGAASEPAAKQRLTAKERNEVFEKVWREIHDHYYDASYNGVDGKTAVTSVIPGTDAARAGIEPGMVVLRVDDTPVAERIAEIEKKRLPSSSERATRWFVYNRVFAGPTDTPVKVALQRGDASVFEVSVRRQVYSAAPEVTTHVLPSGNVYIRFDGFQHPITKEFRQALQKFHEAPGL